MTTLKKYQEKDGSAGTALDNKAQVLSAELKISYGEAVRLVMLQDGELAKSYVADPNEKKVAYTSDVEVRSEELDTKAREYMAKNGLAEKDYSKAVLAVLENQPNLYQK